MAICCLDDDQAHLLRSTMLLNSVEQVVRELLQNSVDANANRIELRVGVNQIDRSIEVSCHDDGEGIHDMDRIGLEYYTSKADGHGEALCRLTEISSIVRIVSNGSEVVFLGGRRAQVKANNEGTTVYAKDVLGPIAVRKAAWFADVDKSCEKLVKAVKVALIEYLVRIRQSVSFSVDIDGKRFRTGPQKISGAMVDLYGGEWNSYETQCGDMLVELAVNPTKRIRQAFFNGRPLSEDVGVKSTGYVLQLTTSKDRCYKLTEIREAVKTIQAPIQRKAGLMPMTPPEDHTGYLYEDTDTNMVADMDTDANMVVERRPLISSQLSAKSTYFHDISQWKITKQQLAQVQVIGQVDNKFILGRFEGTLIAFDQHACDERVQLEQIYQDTIEGTVLATETTDPFEAWGISNGSADRILGGSAGLTAVDLGNSPPPVVRGSAMSSWRCYISTMPPGLLAKCKSKSCRRAIKFGDKLTQDECSRLLQRLRNCYDPFHCAHGRPTIYPICRM